MHELLKDGPLISIADAAEVRLGVRPSYQTGWRYWRHGRHGVKLLTIQAMGRRLTTQRAFDHFVDEVARVEIRETNPEVSDAELKAAGLL